MFYLLKIIIALVVIIGATELSKKNTTLAAILLAMPIIFFVSFTLIWEESKDRSFDKWAYTRNDNVYFARYSIFIFI